MADINVGTMTLAQMIARIIEKQDTFEGGSWILSMIDRLTAERDEARAEVARLRPAAEAWEAQEASLYADANADSYAETGYMRHKAEAAAARARAAKESQP